MNKNTIITWAIGAVVFGSTIVYQRYLMPAAANQIEIELSALKAEIDNRADGSELTYGDVSVSGISASIPNIHFKDGKTGLVGDIESAKITATPGHVQSAELLNYKLTGLMDGNQLDASGQKAVIKNLKYPAMITDKLLISDISFESMKSEGLTAKFVNPKLTVAVEVQASERQNMAGSLLGQTKDTGMMISVEPLNLKIEIPEATGKNMHLPADLNLLDLPKNPEDLMVHISEVFSEGTNLAGNFSIKDKKIGDFSIVSEAGKLGKSGRPIEGKSEGSFTSSATRAQIMEWVKEINAASTPENQIDEFALATQLDKLGVDPFALNLTGRSEFNADGDAMVDFIYDFGQLGKFDIAARVAKLDIEKFQEVVGTSPEPKPEEIMNLLQGLEIVGFDVVYTDGALGDYLLDINPQMPREQMLMMSQMMVPGALKTEPSLIEPATKALTNFITDAKKLEIHAAPTSPVAVLDLIAAVQSGQEIAPLLGLAISGE